MKQCMCNCVVNQLIRKHLTASHMNVSMSVWRFITSFNYKVLSYEHN